MSKSFTLRKDALEWARHTERQADRHELPTDPKTLQRLTLRELVERYRDTVSVKKKAHENERISLNAFLSHQICSKRLSELRTEDFATFRDERLKTIKPLSLKRQLDPIHNLFEIAKDEWGIPIRTNPLDKLKLKAPGHRRERRLRDGEFVRLIEATDSCRNPHIEPIIRLALATGMRRGEIIALRWTDVNHNERSVLKLTARSERLRRDPISAVLRRRFNRGLTQPKAKSDLAAQLASGPIVAVALDTAEGAGRLNEALRLTADRILATLPSARLACLNVLKLGRITIDRTLDEEGHNKHIDRLIVLRHWASPLKLDESRLTVHVLEAVDPAAAILEFAEVNHVDHIVIGARQNSMLRTLLGSVSAKVAAEAGCTVTVVRPPRLARRHERENRT